MKRCSKCHMFKPYVEFHKKLQGLQPICKACVHACVLLKNNHRHHAQNLPEALYRWFTPAHHDECWPWEGTYYSNGYGECVFQKKRYVAHRVIYIVHRGPVIPEIHVCHRCDNRSCVNYINHLFPGTPKENSQDAVLKGHMSKKLSRSDVLTIRALLHTMTKIDLAKMFGVTKSMIYHIENGHCYGDLS